MARWVTVLATFIVDTRSVPSTHMVPNSCMYLQLQGIYNPLLTSVATVHTRCTDIQAGKAIHHIEGTTGEHRLEVDGAVNSSQPLVTSEALHTTGVKHQH